MDILLGWFWPEWTFVGITTYVVIGIIRMYFIFILGFTLKAKDAPKVIVVPLFVYGFLYDIFLNYLISVPTKDLPKKWDETITNRMKRYKETDTGWKYKASVWLCKQLNRYDKGHC